jgi:hypothetical protein
MTDPNHHGQMSTSRRSFHRLNVRLGSALLIGGLLVVALPLSSQAMETGKPEDSVEGYLGLNSTGLSRLQRRSEELVSACMKKEGFEYTPESLGFDPAAIETQTKDREAFAKKYGYGISTLIELPKPGVKSKNEQYVEKLSKADKRAYNIALLGFDPEKNPGGGSGLGLNDKNCIGKATREMFGDLAALTSLGTKFDDLEKRVAANPAVVKAVREWSACLKKSGFTYAKEDDVTGDLSGRLSKIIGPTQFPGAPPASQDKVDRPGLAKLQKDEIALAKVDWDCSKKHLGSRDKISKDLNKAFIAENRAALDKLRTTFGGK